jgi:hypothetical protein
MLIMLADHIGHRLSSSVLLCEPRAAARTGMAFHRTARQASVNGWWTFRRGRRSLVRPASAFDVDLTWLSRK